MNKRMLTGMLALALAFGMLVVGCEDAEQPKVETGGTLTVTNTTADTYDYTFLDHRGDTLDWGTLYSYRSVTLRGWVDGVHELKYRKQATPALPWNSRHGNISGGKNITLNIPVQ